MSLRYKLLLALTAVVALYVVADNLIQRQLVLNQFVGVEYDDACEDLDRTVRTIEAQTADLLDLCGRWARRDETRRWWSEGDTRFQQEELDDLSELGIDLLFACDPSGGVRFGRIEDPADHSPISLRGYPSEALAPGHPLLSKPGRAGLEDTERGFLMVASQEIPGPPGQPALGTVLMGRFLSDALVAEIGHATRVDFALFPLDEERLPARERELLSDITSATHPVTAPRPDGRLDVYTTYSDLRDRPVILLRATLDRDIMASGSRTVLSALLSSIGAALLILLGLLLLLRRTVVSPLGRLTAHAVEIGKNDDTSTRLGMQRKDEIGLLSAEFDRMMDKLAHSRQQLIATARLAGMSEVATGVLHNVGNVLNSVNVSANLVTTEVDALSTGDFAQMVEILEGQEDLGRFIAEDPRGSHFLPYLRELQAELARQKQTIREELRGLKDGISHISDLVRFQQSYAGRSGVRESLSLPVQVNAALNIAQQTMAYPGDVEIAREFDDIPPVLVDRQKLLEVLVNLLQNARHALEQAPPGPRRLTVRVLHDPEDRIRIEVEDNGVGIAPENLSRVFAHGFTTKAEGHGFGLHISANAAAEMGGRLWAESEGPGRGARFVLELPFEVQSRRAA